MNTKKDIEYLANYLRGYADAQENEKLADAADALKKYASALCVQGFICACGDKCTSDHK